MREIVVKVQVYNGKWQFAGNTENCRELTWVLLGKCPPMTLLPLILGEALTCK